MAETHPFGVFVPPITKYFFLGSFTGKIEDSSYDWFYSNKRNQFWSILEAVYGVDLSTKAKKQDLFTELRMAITDIILSCERKANNNLDMNLTNMVFNTEAILKVIQENKIRSIYFSSRFAEKLFKKVFKEVVISHPDIKLLTLPSPSPRYASMNKQEKIARYINLLPKRKDNIF
jgi:hypoxanthine-DNA glycosylase